METSDALSSTISQMFPPKMWKVIWLDSIGLDWIGSGSVWHTHTRSDCLYVDGWTDIVEMVQPMDGLIVDTCGHSESHVTPSFSVGGGGSFVLISLPPPPHSLDVEGYVDGNTCGIDGQSDKNWQRATSEREMELIPLLTNWLSMNCEIRFIWNVGRRRRSTDDPALDYPALSTLDDMES